MTPLENFRVAFIEALHGKRSEYDKDLFLKTSPTTIGLVMAALAEKVPFNLFVDPMGGFWEPVMGKFKPLDITWLLTKPNGQEATAEDQTDEDLDKLTQLLTK